MSRDQKSSSAPNSGSFGLTSGGSGFGSTLPLSWLSTAVAVKSRYGHSQHREKSSFVHAVRQSSSMRRSSGTRWRSCRRQLSWRPLWVNRVGLTMRRSFPVLTYEQTSLDQADWSVSCQEATFKVKASTEAALILFSAAAIRSWSMLESLGPASGRCHRT